MRIIYSVELYLVQLNTIKITQWGGVYPQHVIARSEATRQSRSGQVLALKEIAALPAVARNDGGGGCLPQGAEPDLWP